MLALKFYIMFEMICSLAQKFKNKTFQCTCMSLGWIFSVIQMQLNKAIGVGRGGGKVVSGGEGEVLLNALWLPSVVQ